MYYGPAIILSSGVEIGGLDPKEPTTGIILNLPLAFMNALGTLITAKIIDRLGRRYIMLRFIPGIIISLLIVSYGMYWSTYNPEYSELHKTGGVITLIGLFFFICFFTISLSGVVWTFNSEIFPIHLIGTGNSLATSCNWLSNFIVSSTFLTITSTDAGKVYAYLILCGFSISAWIFVYYLVPETKGYTI
jgi:MFS family permease